MCVKLEEFNNLNYMIKNKYKLKYTNISITLLYIYIYINSTANIIFWGENYKGKEINIMYLCFLYVSRERVIFFF